MSTSAKRKSSDAATSPKKSNALSTETIDYLKAWMMSPLHIEHPYPTEDEKAKIMQDTGISAKQLTCWFSNNRKRYWKVKMEEMGRHDIVEAAMGSSLSPQIIDYLKAWMMSPDHITNPYPTEDEKAQIMEATGIEKKQLTCWFSNNRKRYWKPKMDKLREQFGLSESDPLPPALLAAASATAPTTASASAASSGGVYDAVGSEVAHSTNVYATAPADGPPGMPTSALDDFSPGGYYINSETLQPSLEATVNEVVTEEDHDTKRQKVSLDDVVPV